MMGILAFIMLFIMLYTIIVLFGYWGLLIIMALIVAAGSWALYTDRLEDMP